MSEENLNIFNKFSKSILLTFKTIYTFNLINEKSLNVILEIGKNDKNQKSCEVFSVPF